MSGLGNRLLSGVLALVSVAAVVAPASVWWQLRDQPDVARQGDSPRVELPPATAASFARHARTPPPPGDAPLVLSYHDVQPEVAPDDPYTVTPKELASHLEMLRASGYRPMTGGQLSRWVRGEPAPPRSVVLTFDDNTAGMWKWADPILAETGFSAVVFVITGSMDRRPYYLSWDELDRMVDSGRWQIGSHTHDLHGRVPVSADGPRQPALINRRWIAAAGRLETMDEFTRRITADLDRSLAELAARGHDQPSLFAFPFSAHQTPTNDPAAPQAVDHMLSARFGALLRNSKPPRYPSQDDRARADLPRLEVFSGTTAVELFRQVVAAERHGDA